MNTTDPNQTFSPLTDEDCFIHEALMLMVPFFLFWMKSVPVLTDAFSTD